MASIIGFFDGNTLRAASFEGLLVKNKNTKYWQLKHGITEMPFPDTLKLFENAYITVHILCIAASHIPLNMTTKIELYRYVAPPQFVGDDRGKISIYKSGTNTHSVEFDGFLFHKDDSWGLKDPGFHPMPLGAAMDKAECRLVEMAVEQTYGGMPSILDCNRQIIYS